MRKNLLMVVVLLFLTASSFITIKQVSAATQNSWTSKASMPTARTNLGTALVKGKIFAIGGGNYSFGGALDANEMYDPATDAWTTKASMPTNRSSFGIAVYQNKIYCIGGSTNDGVTGVNEVYDPETDTWETKTAMPTARYSLEANVVDGKIYLIGGSTSGERGTVSLNEVYAPENDTWSTEKRLPTAVQGYSSAVVDDKIYIITDTHTQIYDPSNETWSNGAPIPYYSMGSAAATTGVVAPKRIYVIGGGIVIPYADNYVYDPEADVWDRGADMPTARAGLGIAVVDDVLYAIGGDSAWYFGVFGVSQQYTPFGYGTVPPVVSAVSPENETYNATSVDLVFAVNKPASWMGYSLDGQDNITVTGNATISGLANGLHNVTVYARDEFGNIGASETIYFRIESFPTTLVIASVVTAAIIGIGLLVYFKKHKH